MEVPEGIQYFTGEEITANEERNLNPFAQRDAFAKRLTQIDKGDRTEFQRDKDRILHCKFFRRLMHKTQVFSLTDEYYRTRLTHTLEVMQIARSIARVLGANEDLTEAIAFGHDLGHTPFGHVGERILNEILTQFEDLNGKIKTGCGGFKHNYQAIRLVDMLPTYPREDYGLNLTWQVREGIWKHTRIRKDRKSEGKNEEPLLCNYPDFESEGLYGDYDFSVTIEGQIVAQADEIAQRAHDLDDGLRRNYIKLRDLEKCEKNAFFKEIFNFEELYKIEEENPHSGYVLRQECVRNVISHFVKELEQCAKANINRYWSNAENVQLFTEQNIVTDELVTFNDPSADDAREKCAKLQMKELERYITSRVINSHEVNVSDGRAVYLIKHVFKAYIANPRQLPVETLKDIGEQFKKAELKCIDLTTAPPEEVKECIRNWQGKMPDNMPDFSVLRQHRIFIRAIADFISGLTDNQLKEKYKELYLPD